MRGEVDWSNDPARYFASPCVNAVRKRGGYEAHSYVRGKGPITAGYLVPADGQHSTAAVSLPDVFQPFEPFEPSGGLHYPEATFLGLTPDPNVDAFDHYEKVAAEYVDSPGHIPQERLSELRGQREDLERQLRGYGEGLRKPLGELRGILEVWFMEASQALDENGGEGISMLVWRSSALWSRIKSGMPTSELLDRMSIGSTNATLNESLRDYFRHTEMLPELATCQLEGAQYQLAQRDGWLEQAAPLLGRWEAIEQILWRQSRGLPQEGFDGKLVITSCDTFSDDGNTCKSPSISEELKEKVRAIRDFLKDRSHLALDNPNSRAEMHFRSAEHRGITERHKSTEALKAAWNMSFNRLAKNTDFERPKSPEEWQKQLPQICHFVGISHEPNT